MTERLFLAALAVYVFVLPISGTTALRSLAFAVLVGCTIWQIGRGRLRLDFPLSLPWIVYAAVALASLAYAVDPAYTAGEIKVEVLYPLVIFVIAASWCSSGSRFAALIWLLVAGNVLFVAGSAWTALRGGRPLLGAWDTGVGATATVIVGVLPWILVLGVRLAAESRYRAAVLMAILGAANLGALALTMNRQGWLSLGVSFVTAAALVDRKCWTRRRVALAGIAAAVFLAALAFQFQQRTDSIVGETADTGTAVVVRNDLRWGLWRFSFERIAERPWSGGGFGREAFDRLYRDYHNASIGPLWHAHNTLINRGIQMGVPGMAALLLLWIALASSCAKGLKVPGMRPWAIACLAMLAGIYTRNMVDDFFIRDHTLLFWLLYGAYLGALRHETEGAG